jgi:hypothetical protein
VGPRSDDPYDLASVWPSLSPLYESDELYDWYDSEEWSDPQFGAMVVTKGIRSEAQKRIRRYLAYNGASVWERMERAMDAAGQVQAAHPPSSIVSSITACELLIRYLLLRPLIAGVVFQTKLAMRLIRDPFLRTRLDRELLPHACAAWGITLDDVELPNGEPLWQTLQSLIVVRNKYVHESEPVSAAQAQGAIDCTDGLVLQVLRPLAEHANLEWPPTNWSVRGKTHDPVAAKYDYMGS